MFDKNLRVLIVDPVETQSICIDKMLSRMGYYRIASTTTLIDGLILNNYGSRTFDALILPEHMINPHPGKTPLGFLFNISNLFVYACNPGSKTLELKNKGLTRMNIGLPEYHSLEDFMSCVVSTQSASLARSA